MGTFFDYVLVAPWRPYTSGAVGSVPVFEGEADGRSAFPGSLVSGTTLRSVVEASDSGWNRFPGTPGPQRIRRADFSFEALGTGLATERFFAESRLAY